MDRVAASLERDFPNENQNLGVLLTPLRVDMVARRATDGAAAVRRGRPAAVDRDRERVGPAAGACHRAPSGDGGAHRAGCHARPNSHPARHREPRPRRARRGRGRAARDVAGRADPRDESRGSRRGRSGDGRSHGAAVRSGGLDAGRPAVRPRAGAPAREGRRPRRSQAGRARHQQRSSATDTRGAGRRRDRVVAGPARRRRPDDPQLHQAAERGAGIQPGSRGHGRRQPAGRALSDAAEEGGVLAAQRRRAATGARRRGGGRDQPAAAAARQQHARADHSRTCRPTSAANAHYRTASPDYFRTMEIPLLRGRAVRRRRPRRTRAGRADQRGRGAALLAQSQSDR